MRKFNVLVGVVELIDAESAEAAVAELRTRLSRAGFEPYEESGDAFESETS